MRSIFVGLFLVMLFSCKREKLPPIDSSVDLDGNRIQDSSLISPADFLLSAAIPNPSSADLQKKVVITAHGFSATNFEWQEFTSWAKAKPDLMLSRVLLGGHGRDYSDFQKATWQDWQQPIIDEYNKLVSMGYTNISLAGSSTGCPLILEMLSEHKINTSALRNVFLIDPIIVPSNKILPLAPVIGGWAIEYVTTDLTSAENGYWYKYRPHEALKQLDKLTRRVRKKMEKGIELPTGIALTVFKSEKDDAADPISAALIRKGVKGSVINMIQSDIHVFTRLKGRSTFTTDDIKRQTDAFQMMYDQL